MKILFEAFYHFNGLDGHPLLKILKNKLGRMFMEYRNEVSDVFNQHIDRINNLWDELGIKIKPYENEEYIDPRYNKFVNEHLQPYLDEINIKLKKEGSIWEYYLSEDCDIEGRLYDYPYITINVTFKQIESK